MFYYIEGFYSRSRLHSSLGYLSPEAHERFYQKQLAAAWHSSTELGEGLPYRAGAKTLGQHACHTATFWVR